jgi:hypothetical protein
MKGGIDRNIPLSKVFVSGSSVYSWIWLGVNAVFYKNTYQQQMHKEFYHQS